MYEELTEPARVLIADPPWPFNDALPGTSRGAALNYDLMTLDDIKEFPLPEMAEDSVLFLWRVSSMPHFALEVVQEWGFQPKTELIWRKMTVRGKEHFGMGRILRGAHETCVVATRGRFRPENLSTRTLFSAPVREHSEKPPEFYDIVRELTQGPRVELFARQRREGFYCYGDELS